MTVSDDNMPPNMAKITGTNLSVKLDTFKTGGNDKGETESHNNMPPYYVLRFLIKK